MKQIKNMHKQKINYLIRKKCFIFFFVDKTCTIFILNGHQQKDGGIPHIRELFLGCMLVHW